MDVLYLWIAFLVLLLLSAGLGKLTEWRERRRHGQAATGGRRTGRGR
jgi:hypothetical protein